MLLVTKMPTLKNTFMKKTIVIAVFHKAGSYTLKGQTIHTDLPAFCVIKGGKTYLKTL